MMVKEKRGFIVSFPIGVFCGVAVVVYVVLMGDRLLHLWAIPIWGYLALLAVGAVVALLALFSDS